jgi:hypothetical protein
MGEQTGPAVPRPGRRSEFTDAHIAAVLRAAAARSGDPLSVAQYDAGRHEPSSARIIQRFGSWSAACAAAGLSARSASRTYTRTFDAVTVAAAVARHLAEPGCTGSYAGYAEWAKRTAGAPSAQTVRNTLGSWAQAKAAAGADGRAPQE